MSYYCLHHTAGIDTNMYYKYAITVIVYWQAVINSTITANMTFTKTSQKFGQWSDVRANTVYGLGFASEPELGKVSQSSDIDTCTKSN